jgi:signal transduction histidine kinase
MKSVSAKIVIWCSAALVISLVVFVLVARSVVGQSLMENFDRFNSFQFHQARSAYESGGSAGLSQYLRELNRFTRARFHLTDAQGRDLETGQDHGWLIRSVVGQHKWSIRTNGQLMIGGDSDDGHYLWFVAVTPPSAMGLAPFYLLLLAVVGALYLLVTANIATPLRHLAGVVDRFGRGDLAARAKTKSRDEVGNLGRSFNAMAERIETLLTAERRLLQDVSHELRSPLARLTFEAEMVRKTTDRDASAARLRHEIERLAALVGTLIDMARVEGEPGTVEMERISIDDLVQDIAGDCAVEAAAKGCCISMTPPGAVEIRGNSELLRRAIENVFRNAIRYSPSGTAVEVDLRRCGDSVTIAVRDFGPGIPEDLIPRVFDPFFRADPSRDGSTGGLGLGLAIARRAIRVHQGDITAGNVRPGALLQITIPVDPPGSPD